MEKPKTKKVNPQNSQLGRCCGSCCNKQTIKTTVAPKRGRASAKNASNRQAGDTRAQKSLNTSSLHLKYGVFHNQPNFAPRGDNHHKIIEKWRGFASTIKSRRLGRPAVHQKSEHIAMTKSMPKRSRVLTMNARMEPNAVINFENDILTRTPSAKSKLYHRLSLSEVMHIDIKPPKRTRSPVYWTSSMNTKYYRTPARGRSPKQN